MPWLPAIGRPRRSTVAWMAVGAALPVAAAAALVQLRGRVGNTDVALLILASVLVVALSRRPVAVVVASGSAALSYDFFHTLPYHSLAIANRNSAIATVVLGLLGLAIGLLATHTARAAEELVLVVAVAVFSQAVPEPARLLVDHRALDICLAVLVLVTALGIPTSQLARLGTHGRRIGMALLTTTLALPALSWAASRLVTALELRRGVMVVGLAPAEIASVAAVALAGGDATVAACLLVASTLITVAASALVLRLVGGAGNLDVLGLLGHLALVVGLPMVVGLVVRARVRAIARLEPVLASLSIALVTLLVWLVASQIRLSTSYVGVVAALVVFLAGSILLGAGLSWRAPRQVSTALLLTTSMRDFAIAAGVAVAAFGAAASGPLGIYGVLVLLWGMLVAARHRARSPAATAAPALAVPATPDGPGLGQASAGGGDSGIGT